MDIMLTVCTEAEWRKSHNPFENDDDDDDNEPTQSADPFSVQQQQVRHSVDTLSLVGVTSAGHSGHVSPLESTSSLRVQPTHVASFTYKAKETDEIDLTKGDNVVVFEKNPDGWYVGQNLTTMATGAFPGNFVVESHMFLRTDSDAEIARQLQGSSHISFISFTHTVNNRS